MKGDIQIGEWTVQPQVNSLRKNGEVFHLEPKVMQVLVALASSPNETLTRDYLFRTVWQGTFVSDHVLTRCISELRRVLDDDPRSPRFIQNVPKVGYRLIAPVVAPLTPDARVTHESPAATQTAVPKHLATGRRFVLIALIVLITLTVLGTLWTKRAIAHHSSKAYRTVPFTSSPGSETQPAFSPDGNQIAFVWNDGATSHIFVKQLGNETPLQLTKVPDVRDLSPAWSPDQRQVAFIRQSASGNGVFVVSAIGGAEREVHRLQGAIDWDNPGLSWSPDGQTLIFPEGKSEQLPSAICSLSLDTLESKALTHPLNAWDGDYDAVFSPDGRKIAFVRGTDAAVRNIYVMGTNGGEPKQLTSDGRLVLGLSWSRDGKEIVFSSDRGSENSLWRISADGGTPEPLPMVGAAINPAVALKGDRLAYSEGSASWSTVKLALRSPTAAEPRGAVLVSTSQESAPMISPDGREIAFQSWRSGSQEIWKASIDGSGPVKLTAFDGALTGSPSWSPDGSQIAFDSRTAGFSHIFVMSSVGTSPRALTSGEYNDIVPSWSHDGTAIYFGSKRSGSWQIWKVNVRTGALAQMTRSGGFVAAESPDGRWLYYTRYNVPGLWRVRLNQPSSEEEALPGPPQNAWGYWSYGNGGIYFLKVESARAEIAFAKLGSRESSTVYVLPHKPSPFAGLTVSPDGHSLFYTDEANPGYNIKLVENYE